MSDVLVVGAGMAGLTAARRLASDGLDVTIVDKGRAVGGRMATRRFAGGRFDHGAQHFSARSRPFRQAVAAWSSDGAVGVWFSAQSVTDPDRGVEPRLVGVGAMRSVCEYLADGLDVQTSVDVSQITIDGDDRVVAETAGDLVYRAKAAVVTPPIPQSRRLLGPLDADLSVLDGISYRACLAGLFRLDRSPDVKDGHIAVTDDEIIAWIADNEHKGVSAVPAVTVHSTAGYADRMLEVEPSLWLPTMIARAEELLDRRVTESLGHRWRFAEPVDTLEIGAFEVLGRPPVVVAGEAMAGARVEGAFTSGVRAAEIVAERLSAG